MPQEFKIIQVMFNRSKSCRSFRDYGEAVLKHLENKSESDSELQKAPVNYEGVRVSGYGGWFLLRLSLHDPVLPLNIEVNRIHLKFKVCNKLYSHIQELNKPDKNCRHQATRMQ